MTPRGPQVGQILHARYRIEAFLREGGMASIHRCSMIDAEGQVALKVLHPHFAGKERFVKRFLREAEAIARLEHPNIVKIFDVGESGGLPFLAMELLEGEELGEPYNRGELSPHRTVEIMIEVCRALEHAHNRGVIHRDVKPENIFLAREGAERVTTKVLDFGIAKLLDDEPVEPRSPTTGQRTYLTRVGTLVGTPAYMSPEQGRAEEVDHRHDIYSCGIVLFELITGQRPFKGETPMQIVMRHVNDPCPLPSSLVDVDAGLERVILRALAKLPRERQSSAGELGAELSALLPALSRAPRIVSQTRGPSGASAAAPRDAAKPIPPPRPSRPSGRDAPRPRIPVPPTSSPRTTTDDPTGETVVRPALPSSETVVRPTDQLAASGLLDKTAETVVKPVAAMTDDVAPDSSVTNVVTHSADGVKKPVFKTTVMDAVVDSPPRSLRTDGSPKPPAISDLKELTDPETEEEHTELMALPPGPTIHSAPIPPTRPIMPSAPPPPLAPLPSMASLSSSERLPSMSGVDHVGRAPSLAAIDHIGRPPSQQAVETMRPPMGAPLPPAPSVPISGPHRPASDHASLRRWIWILGTLLALATVLLAVAAYFLFVRKH